MCEKTRRIGLAFGYQAGVPAGASAAWGARTIWKNGLVDLVWDRQTAAGDPFVLRMISSHLHAGQGRSAKAGHDPTESRWSLACAEALRLYNASELKGSDDREVVLFEDRNLVIKANPQGSHGYLYVCAYLNEGCSAGSQQPEGRLTKYNLATAPDGPDLKWSGTTPLPERGTRVHVRINNLGDGEIVGYFVEQNFIGVYVLLDEPAEYFTRQNGGNVPAMLFGAELEPLSVLTGMLQRSE